MSDERERGPDTSAEDDSDAESFDDVDVRDLLRRAVERELPATPPSVLSEVQRRLRDESKGEFFADGWGTARAPRDTYLVTAVVMLVLLVVAWLALAPRGIHLV